MKADFCCWNGSSFLYEFTADITNDVTNVNGSTRSKIKEWHNLSSEWKVSIFNVSLSFNEQELRITYELEEIK